MFLTQQEILYYNEFLSEIVYNKHIIYKIRTAAQEK